MLYACYEKNKKKKHSKAETVSKLTVHSQLLLGLFLSAKIYFVNDEFMAGLSEVRAHYYIILDVTKKIRCDSFSFKAFIFSPLPMTVQYIGSPSGLFKPLGKC